MPSASDILLGLWHIATNATRVSIAWHIVLAASLIALLAGFRPPQRVAAALLSAPLLSVAALAFAFGNPFNGAVFSVLAVALATLALRVAASPISLRRGWSGLLGTGLIVFGAVYPHFIEGASWLTYLYAAPLGAIPCPTLSAVIGAALIVGGFDSHAWRLTLAGAGCFYAVIGVLRLGVIMDAVLLGGAAGLVMQSIFARSLASHSASGSQT